MSSDPPTHSFWKAQLRDPPHLTVHYRTQPLPIVSTPTPALRWEVTIPPLADYLGAVSLSLTLPAGGDLRPILTSATLALEETVVDTLDRVWVESVPGAIVDRGEQVLWHLPFSYQLLGDRVSLSSPVTLSLEVRDFPLLSEWVPDPDGDDDDPDWDPITGLRQRWLPGPGSPITPARLLRADLWIQYLRLQPAVPMPLRIRGSRRRYSPLRSGDNTLLVAEGRPVARLWWYLQDAEGRVRDIEWMSITVGGDRRAAGTREVWTALQEVYGRGDPRGIWSWRHDLHEDEVSTASHQLTLRVAEGGWTCVVYLWERMGTSDC